MARRQASVSDSLDLLLDTICNMFGGILFIALLVVILLQLHGDEAAATNSPPITPQALELLQADLAARHADLHRLRDLHDGQQQTLAALAPADLEELVDEHRAAVAANTELTRQREQMFDDIAGLTRDIVQTEADLRTADADLQKARADVAELERQLEADRKSRRRELRTPLQRPSASRSEIGCVMQYGRFYVWHRYDQFGLRDGLNTEDFLVLDDAIEGAYIAPRPTAGISLDGSADSRRRLITRLERFHPESAHIAVIVRPDSFAEWPQVRDLLIERGFEYRLMPTDTAIVDRGADESRVQ